MFNEFFNMTLSNVCMSGGAVGADLQWGMMAGRYGHNVIHWSFDNHKTHAPTVEVVKLDLEQLKYAEPFVKRANKTLNRNITSQYMLDLICRSYYQVAYTHAVYAIGNMSNQVIEGGTSWAIQMYQDRFLFDMEDLDQCHLYFYDQTLDIWFEWKGRWKFMISTPPVPNGIWTGIGSRKLSKRGKWQIRNLLGGYPINLNEVHPLINIPKLYDIVYVPDIEGFTGGWAKVNSIIIGEHNKIWISVEEYCGNNYFEWDKLKQQQIDLREKFKLIRATIF